MATSLHHWIAAFVAKAALFHGHKMEGRYKYIHCETDPPQLYDRVGDPNEHKNLAGRSHVAEVENRLASFIAEHWDLAELHRTVLESQRRRRIVDRSHGIGQRPSWDHDSASSNEGRYFRPCDANPSASNYNARYEVRLRADSEIPNIRDYP